MLLGMIGLLYLACVNNHWYPTPDSAFYVGLGRSLAEGQGYTFNGHLENTVTPGMPVIIAAARVVTGGEGWWLCNLFVAVMGVATLAAVWAALRRLMPEDEVSRCSPDLAWLAVLATGGTYLFFLYSHQVLTDVPFLAAAYGAFWACVRFLRGHWAWLVLSVVLTATALTIRVPGALLVGLLVAGLAVQPLPGVRMKRRILAFTFLTVTILATVGFWYVLGRSLGTLQYVESTGRYLGEFQTGFWPRVGATAVALGEIMSKILVGTDDLPWLGAAGWVLVLGGLTVLTCRGLVLPLVVVVFYTLAMAAIRRADLPDRYLLPVLPLILLGLLQGAWSLAAWLSQPRDRKPEAQAAKPQQVATASVVSVIALTAVVMLANAVEVAKLGYELAYLGRTDQYEKKAHRGNIAERRLVGEILKAQLPEDGLFAADRAQGRIVHYFADRRYVELQVQGNDPAQLWAFWQEHPEVAAIILPSPKRTEDVARLSEVFASDRELHRGKSFVVYVRQRASQ